MMDALEVPPVRSRVMWAAVTLATRWDAKRWRRVSVVLWFLMAAAGMALLVYGVVTGSVGAIVVALVGPAIAAALWGHQYWAGVIAGYTLPPVVLPALASVAGYSVYWIAEWIVKAGRHALPGTRPYLPRPVKYRDR